MRHRIRGTLGIIRCLGGRPRIREMRRPSMSPSPGRRRLCGGCFPGNNNSVFAFRVGNSSGGTRSFVSGLRLFSLLTGMTSIGSLIVRPTAAARDRYARRRLLSRKVGPGAVHLSVNARGVSSVVRSLSRTFGTVRWVAVERGERVYGG